MAGGEKRDSEETGVLKTVASVGPWHSEEKSEEALMTNPNFGPNRRQNELGLRSWHREEKIEEALLTSLKDWAKLPPARLGNLDSGCY